MALNGCHESIKNKLNLLVCAGGLLQRQPLLFYPTLCVDPNSHFTTSELPCMCTDQRPVHWIKCGLPFDSIVNASALYLPALQVEWRKMKRLSFLFGFIALMTSLLVACGGGSTPTLGGTVWIGTKQLGVAGNNTYGKSVATDVTGNV